MANLMKASEVIIKLEKIISEHGDEEIRVIADPKENPFIKDWQEKITHGDIHKIEVGYRGFLGTQEKIKFIFIFAG